MKSLLALLAALFTAAAALAADAPEAVYAKYHRAAVTGDLAEMAKYLPAAQRGDLGRMSGAQKEAQAKMLAATMPRAFLVKLRQPGKAGELTLIVSGPGDAPEGEKPPTLYGTIRLAQEGAEWKVMEAKWSGEAPAALTVPKRPDPAAEKAAARAAAAAPVVGSMEGAPVRKLGTQKAPCVFKPVMTAEDLENCK
jgi:hypothetical protein